MRISLTVAALVLGAVFLSPAVLAKGGKKDKPLAPFDYEAYFENLPRMQEISETSNKNIKKLHKLMKELSRTEAGNSKEQEETRLSLLRKDIRRLLSAHRKLKVEMIQLCDRALKKQPGKKTNIDALRSLRNRELHDVHWSDVFLKYVVKDLAIALDVPVRLQNSVQELNQVNMDFRTISADAAMQIICQNFDLKYIIYDGEITIYRKLNRNEERFLEYEKKTGQKIDWIAEDEAMTRETITDKDGRKVRKLKKLEDFDLPYLNQQMVKLYILEGESKRHELRLKELKLAAEFIDMVGKVQKTKDSEEDRIKRHKHVVHYVWMERDNAIEVWDIVNRVLGDVLEVPEDNALLREILKKEIPSIQWKNQDVETALYEIGRIAGVEIELDIPGNIELSVNLSAENLTVKMVLDFLSNQFNLDWRFVNGKFFFAYMGGDEDE
jgi:hypothetical protein